jgi:CBS domain-containing protein
MSLQIESGSSIKDAMMLIEFNRHKSLVIVSKGKAIGVVSDGDIRKALLHQKLLSSPIDDVMNVNYIKLEKGNEDKAKDIFYKLEYVYLIPVVDDSSNLIKIISRLEAN